MTEAKVVGRIIRYGSQQWQCVENRWYVMMFGTSGPNQNPHWFWSEIELERVPEAVKNAL